MQLPSGPWLLILVLAVFRVSWFITREEGPFNWMGSFRHKLNVWAASAQSKSKTPDVVNHGLPWTIASLFNCPLCVGFWLSLVAFLVYGNFPTNNVVLFIFLFLALAGAQTFLTLLILDKQP